MRMSVLVTALCCCAIVCPAGWLNAQADTTGIPLITWEDVLPARRGVVLWARNPSADTVWIDSLHVEHCLNIRRKGCGTRAMGVVLAPGTRRELLRLEPAVPNDPFGYRWFLDWTMVERDSLGTRRRIRRHQSPAIRS